jgi:drug/metabolite transporter (DMT)-like permease
MPYFLLLLVVLFWSGNFIVANGIQHNIPPISLSFLRWMVAFLILLPFTAKSVFRRQELLVKHWKLLAFLGMLGVTNFSTFLYLGLKSSTVTNTVLVNSFTPIFIVLILWALFKERITLLQLVGIMISLCGMIWIITRGNPAVLLTFQFVRGDLWTLAASFSWALYTVLLKRYPPGLEPNSFLTVLILIGLVFLSPLFIWEIYGQHSIRLNFATVSGIIYLGIFASLLAYIFWNKAVNMVGAHRAGVFHYLIPVFSITLAFFIFDERFKSYHPPGIFFIFLGIYLTTRGN